MIFRPGVWKSALGYVARATRPCICSSCCLKTHFSFLPLENRPVKTPAVRLLRGAGVRSALSGPNSTPDNSIEAMASAGHRYLHFPSHAAVLCSRAAADFLLPKPGCMSWWGYHVASLLFALLTEVVWKGSKGWKVLWIPLMKFASSSMVIFCDYGAKSYFKNFSVVSADLSPISMDTWVVLRQPEAVNSSRSLAAQWPVKSCWSH